MQTILVCSNCDETSFRAKADGSIYCTNCSMTHTFHEKQWVVFSPDNSPNVFSRKNLKKMYEDQVGVDSYDSSSD